MVEILKSGRIFSICKCAAGKDYTNADDKEEISECQKEMECFKEWGKYGKYCYYYRYTCGHCDRINSEE